MNMHQDSCRETENIVLKMESQLPAIRKLREELRNARLCESNKDDQEGDTHDSSGRSVVFQGKRTAKLP